MAQENMNLSRLRFRLAAEIMLCVALALFVYGPLTVAAELGAFGSDVFFAPMRLMWQFRSLSLMVIIVVAGMFYLGIRKQNLRLLIPGAVTLVGVYWFAACTGIVMIVRSAFLG